MRYRIGDVVIHPGARQVQRAGAAVRLGGRAFDLLLALIERRERVVSKEELDELVWPDVHVEPNNLAFQVWALRRLLGAQALATVARRGYRLVAPVEALPDDDEAGLTALPAAASEEPVARVLHGLGRQRAVTLVCPHAPTRAGLARQVAHRLGTRLPGGSWWLPPDAGTASLQLLLNRLGQRPALLVLEDVHLQPRAAQGLVDSALAQSATLRLLMTSMRALGHGNELSMQIEADLHHCEPSSPDWPGRLRWRPRPS